jgi:hypothetical protein
MRSLRQMFAVAAFAAAAQLSVPASATNLSDLWFDSAEPGWGLNIVQQEDVGFGTLFVHGPDREATWYVAPHMQLYALSNTGLPYLRGVLYRTRAPWFGGPFDPASVEVVAVGDIDVEPLTTSRLRIVYRIGAVTRSKTVTRQTWRVPAPSWTPYDARFHLHELNGPPGSGVPRRFSAVTWLELGNGTATMTVQEGDGRSCEYHGPYEQTGRLGGFSGAFTCDDGRSGSFQVEELELTREGLSARIRGGWNGGSFRGRFAGPRF